MVQLTETFDALAARDTQRAKQNASTSSATSPLQMSRELAAKMVPQQTMTTRNPSAKWMNGVIKQRAEERMERVDLPRQVEE